MYTKLSCHPYRPFKLSKIGELNPINLPFVAFVINDLVSIANNLSKSDDDWIHLIRYSIEQ